jgi:hypothetical protein
MKLFGLRLTTLKSKLYAIVFASFVVRVVAFFALPNTASNLAPDEGTYAGLAEVVAKGVPVDETQFGEGLYLISRAFIIPASLLVRLGFSSLDAVRLIASLHGLLTITLITVVLLRVIYSRREVENFILQNQGKVLILHTIFTLLPSHLIWSVLGLREATMEFWVLAVFILVFYAFAVEKSPPKLTFLGVLIAIPMVFLSRQQVGWVLGVTLLLYCLISIKVKVAQILIPVTLLGISLGYIGTTALSFETTQKFIAKEKVGFLNVTEQTRLAASELCRKSGSEVEFSGAEYTCVLKRERTIIGLKNPGFLVIEKANAIPTRNEENQVGAASAIKTLQCPNDGESRLDRYFCLTYRASYTTATFLFRPMLGADVTSTSSLFAAVENVFWLAAALFVVVMFIRNRRLAFFGALAPSLLFFSIYSVAAGAYEGNMGTAFRHKSLILWVVILLLASTIVATQQRKAEQQKISGSSKE